MSQLTINVDDDSVAGPSSGGIENPELITPPVQEDIFVKLFKTEHRVADKTYYFGLTQLKGHSPDKTVNRCRWNRNRNLLATGSDDENTIIWNEEGGDKKVLGIGSSDGIVSLDWDPFGNYLATGDCIGNFCIWKYDGSFINNWREHDGGIRALKWNPMGSCIVTGDNDGTAIIWKLKRRRLEKKYAFHRTSIVDVDWQNNEIFASSSNDGFIQVCSVNTERPVKTFADHRDAVYSIEWSPAGRFLASASDDQTVKIWSMDKDVAVHNLTDHEDVVNKVVWSPTGKFSANANLPLKLASGSDDCTVRLWEPEQGYCLYTLQKHSNPIKSLAFSPDGCYLASVGHGGEINIWSTGTGDLCKSFRNESFTYIADVCWDNTGNRVTVCGIDGKIYIYDCRM